MFDQGPHAEMLIKQSKRAGLPIPEKILNAPELLPGLEFYLSAFFDLDGERHIAELPGKIPFSAIENYASVYGIEEEDRVEFHELIKRLDEFHLKRIYEKSRETIETSKSKAKVKVK